MEIAIELSLSLWDIFISERNFPISSMMFAIHFLWRNSLSYKDSFYVYFSKRNLLLLYFHHKWLQCFYLPFLHLLKWLRVSCLKYKVYVMSCSNWFLSKESTLHSWFKPSFVSIDCVGFSVLFLFSMFVLLFTRKIGL